MKVRPLKAWSKENNKPYHINGIMRSEGGRRAGSVCLAFRGDKLMGFHPLSVISKEWEEWFIEEHGIRVCEIYAHPYNQERTGCKGCPYNIHLQEELDTLERYLPNEARQCEIIWKPVYDEYRRLGYRLRQSEIPGQMSIEDYLKESEDI